jgi:hypothetical protein
MNDKKPKWKVTSTCKKCGKLKVIEIYATIDLNDLPRWCTCGDKQK